MQLLDLFERANVSFPGSNRVVDLRDPAAKKDKADTHVVLTKDGGAFIYNYASGNKIEWNYPDGNGEGVYQIISKAMDTTLQTDTAGIRLTAHGILLSRWRDNGTWTGNKNRFSLDIRPTVERLLDLGIAFPRTPIYVGNWARRNDDDAELIGSAAQIMKAPNIPNKIMLYHGTSNARAIQIMEHGLAPLDQEARVWNGDKNERMPEHRADSVYLTASMSQAEYYANKAVKTDRKRLSWNYRWNMESKINNLIRKPHTSDEEAQAKIERMKATKDLLHKMSDTVAKVEPVILGVELTRPEYKNLMADDDYINKMKSRGQDVSPDDWRDSLSDFGQVAYRGTIPAYRIKKL